MDKKIDLSSNIPYYVQLYNIIKSLLESGYWKLGDKMPGEPELCIHYGVSRTVVRQALRELELEGLIIRRKGKGTFISRPKIAESLVEKLTGFYQDMVEKGYTPKTDVLIHETVPVDEKIAGFLNIDPGDLVIMIKRVRFVNDEPIQVTTSYLPQALCPQLASVDLTNSSLYDFLENKCGLFITEGRRFIEAIPAGKEEASLLHIDVGSPLIMLESVSFLENGKPVEYYRAMHRGDRSRFEVKLVRVPKQLEATTLHDESDLPISNSYFLKE